MKKINLVYCISSLLIVCFIPEYTRSQKANPVNDPLSDETQECIDCHKDYTPGIVEDWLTSRHSKISPEKALKKSLLERRISSENIPEKLLSFAVGCYECHGQNPEVHKDNFEHFGYQVNVVVSPNDCGTCHSVEVEQYSGSKKANALGNLQKNPVYHTLVETITSVKEVKGDELVHLSSSETTKGETCYSCHGSSVRVTGLKKISTDLGDIDVPVLTNWPNQGVGRVNPDGSLGACTVCHPRHSFSIEIARKPYTCSQCHLQPDVPAWEVYRESKHGNIFLSKGHEWDWNRVPWRVGKDFKAPTCASCHNSLLVTPEGDVIVPRTHDFGSRLWVRLFGLIYTHPQPKDGKTYVIKNKEELPLPTTFTGEIASEYLIDKQEQEKRKGEMKKICRSCHSTDWADQHFVQLDETIKETDKMVYSSTQLLLKAWDKGMADQSNPFDEAIEQMWIKQWLFYANSVRYGSAMGGPDYSTFKNGWWGLTENLQKMHEYIERKK
jgi:hypothetical protein